MIGDSHARVFLTVRDRSMVPRTWIDVCWVTGATALGLANPNSTTNALATFSDAIDRVPRRRPLLFVLGEVDCGFLVWHRSMTRGTTVEHEFDQSLARYVDFLETTRAKGHDSIALMSVVPPTIVDYSTWKGLDNARREVTASLPDRTALTLRYNRELRAWADASGATFVDLDPDVIDPSTGLVAERFVRPNLTDHHLAREPLAHLVADKLIELQRTGW